MSSIKSGSSGSEEVKLNGTARDYLYNDARRVGSFLAQFEPQGHLQSSKQTVSAASSSSDKSTFGGSGGVPGFLSLKADGESLGGESSSEAGEKTYDPLWRNAAEFERSCVDGGLLVDLEQATLGSLVRFEAWLSILNASLLGDILKNQKLNRMIFAGIPKVGKVPDPSAVAALEMLPMMTAGMQGHYLGEGFRCWSSLNGDYLSTNAGDLQLKHGTLIGTDKWTVIAIADARPYTTGTDVDLGASLFPEGALRGIATMINTCKPLVGRQPEQWGITPLLIYRDVGRGISETDAPGPSDEEEVAA